MKKLLLGMLLIGAIATAQTPVEAAQNQLDAAKHTLKIVKIQEKIEKTQDSIESYKRRIARVEYAESLGLKAGINSNEAMIYNLNGGVRFNTNKLKELNQKLAELKKR